MFDPNGSHADDRRALRFDPVLKNLSLASQINGLAEKAETPVAGIILFARSMEIAGVAMMQLHHPEAMDDQMLLEMRSTGEIGVMEEINDALRHCPGAEYTFEDLDKVREMVLSQQQLLLSSHPSLTRYMEGKALKNLAGQSCSPPSIDQPPPPGG